MPFSNEESRQLYEADMGWLKYREESQALADKQAAESDPGVLEEIWTAAVAGAAETADETLTTFAHDLPQLLGAEGTGVLNPVATTLGVEGYEPDTWYEEAVFDIVNLGTAYAVPGTLALKGAGAAVKGAKALKGVKGAGQAEEAAGAAQGAQKAAPAGKAADATAKTETPQTLQRKIESVDDDLNNPDLVDEYPALQAERKRYLDQQQQLMSEQASAGKAAGGVTEAAGGAAPTAAKPSPFAKTKAALAGDTAQVVGRESARAGVGSMIGRDPYAERLLLLKQSSPGLREAIEEWEEAPDPEHSRWQGKIANLGEEAGLWAAPSFLAKKTYDWTKRAILARRKGKPEMAPEVAGTAQGGAAQEAAKRSAVQGAMTAEKALAAATVGAKKQMGPGDFGDMEGTMRAMDVGEQHGLGGLSGMKAPVSEGKEASIGLTPDEMKMETPEGAWKKDGAVDETPKPEVRLAATTGAQVLEALEDPKDMVAAIAGDTLAATNPGIAARNTAVRINATAQALGLGDVGGPELQRLHQRLKEWRALTKKDGITPRNDQYRGGAALAALQDYAKVVRAAAKARGVDADVALGEFTEMDSLWSQVVGKNPLYEAHMPSMERPKYAARRSRPAAEVRAESTLGSSVDAEGNVVPSKGLSPADWKVFRENVGMHEGIIVDEDYAPGSAWGSGFRGQPVDVYFADVKSVTDFEGVTAAVRAQTGMAERAGGEAGAIVSLDRLLRDAVHGRPQGMVDQIMGKRLRTETYKGQQADILDTATAMASTVRDLGKIAAGKGSTPEQRLQFIRAAQKFDAYLHWARGDMDLAERSMREASDTVLENLDEVARRMRRSNVLEQEGDTYSRAMAGSIAYRDTLHGVADLVTRWRADQRSLMDRARIAGGRYVSRPARELWINSVLSSPATHMRNIVGNSILPMMQVPEHFLAGSMEGGLKQGYREGMAAFQGLMAGMKDGVRIAGLDWKMQMAEMADDTVGIESIAQRIRALDMGEQHREFIQKIKVDDVAHAKALGLPQHMLDKMGTNGGWMEALGKSMDVGIRRTLNAPTAALRSEDVFYKTMTYRMEVNRLAARRAHQEGLNGQAFTERVAEIKRNPAEHLVDVDGRQVDIRTMAMDQSHINTYTNDLEGFAQSTLDQLNRTPGARYVVPFFRTPWNITVRATEHVPGLGMYIGRQKKLWAEGGRGKQEVIARQITGGAVMAALTPMVLQGNMIGGSVHNPQYAWTARKLGRQDYSLKVGDTWVDYRRVGGSLGVTLGVVTDAVTAVHAASTDEEYRTAVALWHTASGIAASLLGETWAGDVNDFLNIVATGDARAFERWSVRTGAGFAPYSGLSDDVRESISLALGMGRYTATQAQGGMAGADETTWEMVSEAWTSTYRKAIGPFALIGEDARPKLGPYGQPIKPFEEGMFSGPLGASTAYSGFVWLQERTDALSQETLRLQPQGVLSVPRTFSVTGARGQIRRMEYTGEQQHYLEERRGRYWLQYGTRVEKTAGYRNGTDVKKKALLIEAAQEATTRAVRETEAHFPDIRRRKLDAQNQLNAEYRG